jgi:hypothetical protein
MAKLYKVRKKCLICKNVFYPSYSGSLYCQDCKNGKNGKGKLQNRKMSMVLESSECSDK